MASGNIDNPMGTEIVQLTKNDPNNILYQEYVHKVYKSGSIKILRLGIEPKDYTGVNAWKQIYDLPSKCLPVEDLSCNCITRSGVVIQFQVTTTGKVNFNSPNSLALGDFISVLIPYI